MPKIVDHDARRAEIVRAFLLLAAREGLAAATSRNLATELGVASGALWRYFDDYDALLEQAYERVYGDTNERIDARAGELTGLAAIDAMMREILPLEPLTRSEAVVVVGFWGRIVGSERLRSARLTASGDWHARFLRHLREAVDSGEVVPTTPVDAVADLLVTLAMGQQVEYVTHGSSAEPSRQLAALAVLLEAWRTHG